MDDLDGAVLILGAGINGAALARELLLNGVSVIVVDRHDVACGATAYSSRLVHGGLRYLEYGEFSLVRESLAERTRLLRQAPHLVRPLRLVIPLERRLGGLAASARRFLRMPPPRRAARGGVDDGGSVGKNSAGSPQVARAAASRGMYVVAAGLALYDVYARDPSLPKRRLFRAGTIGLPAVRQPRYRWLYSYYDAQVEFPERLTLALLEDARRIAADRGASFTLLTYCDVRCQGAEVVVEPRPASATGALAGAVRRGVPRAVVNATGAWVDATLRQLSVAERRLMGGTKGSHFVSWKPGLREQLGDAGIYAEAADGRPVFILPLAGGMLVGTTDERYEGDPAHAVADGAELDYLLALVNDVLPGARLERSDIDLHYSGVRPLPYVASGATAAITRRHWVEQHDGTPWPMISLVGGKLTTCRSLAQDAAARLLHRLGVPVTATSEERPLPGGQQFPVSREALDAEWTTLASTHGWTVATIAAMWRLIGTTLRDIAAEIAARDGTLLLGTELPRGFASWVIEHESAARLEDLVERRLMLVYHPALAQATLVELAALLVGAGRLPASQLENEVAACCERFAHHFGRSLPVVPPLVDDARAASAGAGS